MADFRISAEQGDADAQFALGVMCAEGEGVPAGLARRLASGY